MALDKELTAADAEKHSNALAWKTTRSGENALINVAATSSSLQPHHPGVKTSVIQRASEPQATKHEDTVTTPRVRSLSHDMDPSGQFHVPLYRNPDGDHMDYAASRSRASVRPAAALQRRDLETPPGLVSRAASSQQAMTGVTSPTFSDVSLLRMTPGGDDRARTNSRDSCRWPHYRVIPPIWGTPDPHEAAATKDYEPPPSAGSFAETDIFPSHYASPRQSAHLRRKRPISISPFSLDVDINQLIRTSPSSLVAYINGSRVPSVNSGSYGHLAPGKSSPSFNFPGAPPHLVRRESPTYRPTERSPTPPPLLLADADESEPAEENANARQEEMHVESKEEETDVKREADVDGGCTKEDECLEEEGKQEEVDANCHWKECKETFESRQELVQHVNSEHIHGEKRDFTCHWQGCCRLQKPFKAQYMLVVHMRRHTGEKPHKCTFEGCSKAYSRLENLKTHLRSHTGEKPYMCEFPGCTKAFTNASDRAKHQNRTHSNLKPYVCKNAGCPKRYTDPSSLRKHMKSCQLGVKKARGEDYKDASAGIQTFPPTSQQSVKPVVTSLESKNVSNECMNIQKIQQVDQSLPYVNHQMSHSPDKTELGFMYADRRYSNASQLSTGGMFIDDPAGGNPGSRRGSNFSQASNCSYVSQGHAVMIGSDPNALAGRRGSGDVSPAGLPLNTSPNAFLMSQQQQQMFNQSSPRMGQHHGRSLTQEPGCRRESGISLSEFVPSPSNHASRRSSVNSTFSFPPPPDSGIGCFDYGSRRSSNSSETSASQPYFMSVTGQVPGQSPSPYGMHRPSRPPSGRLLQLHGQSKFALDESQAVVHGRRASEGNASYGVYRLSECHNTRRASDPLHHLPHPHTKLSSRSYLRNQLTPTQPLPLPPSMQQFQQQGTGYAHAPSPLPMAVDDSQSTFTAMMHTTKLHHAVPSPSYTQGPTNPQIFMQQQQHRDAGMEDMSMDMTQLSHSPAHAGHTGVMPQCNGFMQHAASNVGMAGLMPHRSSLLNDHHQWMHGATDEPLTVYT